ncbi:MAG: glycoside hydrolase family 3 N-terminal domain-containing protein [Alphaproteobacteria bacterium]
MVRLPKAAVFGCKGTTLTQEEQLFFKRTQPLGFILFERNCDNPKQVKRLIESLKEVVDHENPPILIDQEGGNVVRLKPPHWHSFKEARFFGKLATDNIEFAETLVFDHATLLGCELSNLGITVNCSPCIDLYFPNKQNGIEKRAFSSNPNTIAHLALKVIQGYHSQGITSVIKHMPGHGRAPLDSHQSLPIVTDDRDTLIHSDIEAFRLTYALMHSLDISYLPWGMTAHVAYSCFDKKETPATHSEYIINTIIRQQIGFKGFLISDCITMKALKGSFASRARKSLKSGCNAVLHCSGNIDEMIEIAGEIPQLSNAAFKYLRLSNPLVNPMNNLQFQEKLKEFSSTLQHYSIHKNFITKKHTCS